MRITSDRLKEVLDYDPNTGIFRHKIAAKGRPKPGKIAGCIKPGARGNGGGYRVVRVDRVLYRAHHLAWLYVYGVWPSHDLDHRDLDRSNNAIGNLRLATRAQNNINGGAHRSSHLGIRGVGFDKERGKFRAQIMKDGKNHMLGRFETLEEAIEARNKAGLAMFGEFARAA